MAIGPARPEVEVSMSIKGDFFGALKALEDAIAAALDKLPSPQKETYTKWVGTQLIRVRRDFALYAKRLQEDAKRRGRRRK